MAMRIASSPPCISNFQSTRFQSLHLQGSIGFLYLQALRCLSSSDRNLETHNYFMLFGGGTRLCSGKELGLAEISIFLHYFVTKYRWEEVGGDKLVTFPRVEAPNGLHIQVSNY